MVTFFTLQKKNPENLDPISRKNSLQIQTKQKKNLKERECRYLKDWIEANAWYSAITFRLLDRLGGDG